MPPQEIPSEVKACKAIADGKERLKCFDELFGETQKPQNLPKEVQANWSIDETKSSITRSFVVKTNRDLQNALTAPNDAMIFG